MTPPEREGRGRKRREENREGRAAAAARYLYNVFVLLAAVGVADA